ncbi:Uncharacterised protein [Serratia proteamaculans]|nr:Uncharacterised protein [Serratia proteamaculans]
MTVGQPVGEQGHAGGRVNGKKRGWMLRSGLAMMVLTGVVFLQCGGRTDMSLHTVLAIAAPTLFRDYRENQVVTAARLAGKQVQVSGVVVS